MRVLVVGGGAREHALAWRLNQDEAVREVLVAPGNAGTTALATNRALPSLGSDASVRALTELATREAVDLVVVGPEAPLVAGAVDALEAAGILAFGPSRGAARLEGSKSFSKHFMKRHGIPTAAFEVFSDADAAKAYLDGGEGPIVVKADGLAAGKGVTVAADRDEAKVAVERMMTERAFGEAGAEVVVEETLRGQEVSFHVVSDGERYVALAPAQDHKRAFDGDQGPNTGGMGAYSPPPIVDAAMEARICAEIVEPTLRGMRNEGCPFRGALFVGLMIGEEGPRVLEYNVRFGDPECECLMLRLGGSFAELLVGGARGDLRGYEPTWRAAAAMAVVLASGGYPGPYPKGHPISGLAPANAVDGVHVFHAGTALDGETYRTAGGRVLAVTASGDSVEMAAERAYRAADLIVFDGKQHRRDIGYLGRA